MISATYTCLSHLIKDVPWDPQLVHGLNSGFSNLTAATGYLAIIDILISILSGAVLRKAPPIEIKAIFIWSNYFVDFIYYFVS